MCIRTNQLGSGERQRGRDMLNVDNRLHDFIAPTATGPPIWQLEQTEGLIRIGFLTGNAINLIQDWDLHP